jgi:hypothetical protein
MAGTRVMTLGKATQPISGCDCGGGLRGVPANPRKTKPVKAKRPGAKTRYCIKVGKVTTRCFASERAAQKALDKRNTSGRARKKARLVTKKS